MSYSLLSERKTALVYFENGEKLTKKEGKVKNGDRIKIRIKMKREICKLKIAITNIHSVIKYLHIYSLLCKERKTTLCNEWKKRKEKRKEERIEVKYHIKYANVVLFISLCPKKDISNVSI